MSAGAYGMAMSSNYNSRPRAAEVLVDGVSGPPGARPRNRRAAVCPRAHSGLTIVGFMTTTSRRFALAGVVVALLAAVGLGTYFVAADGRPKEAPKGAGKGPQAVLITAAVVQPRTLEIYEEVVGTIENVIDPTIGAEVAGRVTRVAGFTGKKVTKGEVLAEIDAADFEIQSRGDQAEIGRLTSLLEQQERVVERQQKLVGQGFISQNALDDAIAQRNALREQLAAARARAEATGRSLTKSRVVAPIDGEIEDPDRRGRRLRQAGRPAVQAGRRAGAARAPAAARSRRDAHPDRPQGGAVAAGGARAHASRRASTRSSRRVGANNRALDAIVKFRGDGNTVPRRRHGERAHRHPHARWRADGARAERGAAPGRQGGLPVAGGRRAPARGGDRPAPGRPAGDRQGPGRRRDGRRRRRRLPHRRRGGSAAQAARPARRQGARPRRPRRRAEAMTLSELSIRRHVFAFMLSAVLVLFGAIAYQRMGVDKLPYIEFPVISITTAYKGANPDIIDASITNLIETSVNSVPGIEHIQSTSSPGTSVVVITFGLEKRIDVAFQEVQAKVNQVVRRLPKDADPPVVAKVETNTQAILQTALQGDRTQQQLNLYAINVIKKQLETIDGVGEVRIGGRRDRNIRVNLLPARMAALRRRRAGHQRRLRPRAHPARRRLPGRPLDRAPGQARPRVPQARRPGGDDRRLQGRRAGAPARHRRDRGRPGRLPPARAR